MAARNIDAVPLPAGLLPSSSIVSVYRVHAVRPAACVGSRDASPQALRGVRHDGCCPRRGQTVPGGALYWERLRELIFPLVCHLPGEEGSEVWGCLAALGDTGVEERAQPMAGSEAPHQESLEHTKHHGGEMRTPDAAGAIIVLAADDR